MEENSKCPILDGGGMITINATGKCTICLRKLGEEPLVTIEECSHKFHVDCLQRFNYPRCPLCGKEYDWERLLEKLKST